MSVTPFEALEGKRIGIVEHVSPGEVRVLLDSEAPTGVALHEGSVRPFPRVNDYVLVVVDEALLACQVEWLTMDRTQQSRSQLAREGLVDLPQSRRRLSAVPVGTLSRRGGADAGMRFSRGADALPTVGSTVLIASEARVREIVESGSRRRVKIGTSLVAAHAEVRVDPDRLFGRHLAVLGNTGSGKSCSVAGLIRWSLEEAIRERQGARDPNARFVVLDPNGEYARAFKDWVDEGQARVYRLDPGEDEAALRVPLWFWNSSEWSAFCQASVRAQRPLLRRALREVRVAHRDGGPEKVEEERSRLRRYASHSLVRIRHDVATSAIKDDKQFGFRLLATLDDLRSWDGAVEAGSLQPALQALERAVSSNRRQFVNGGGETIVFFLAYDRRTVAPVISALEALVGEVGGELPITGTDADVPLPFRGADLADHLELLAAEEGSSQYVDFLVTRIRNLLAEPRIDQVVGRQEEASLADWLASLLPAEGAESPRLAILDLSLVPWEVLHLVIAVVSRILFEALQRFRRWSQQALPTVLVLEEAHTFARRAERGAEELAAATVCRSEFERIAREGRKFGLGLVVSSQRPSELSPTVLSQCNTFLLHRVTNDRDQDLVGRLLPDSLKGILRELPSLSSQQAILMGWATEVPLLVRVRDLAESAQPRSENPDFWSVWTGRDEAGQPVKRMADWEAIAKAWQGGGVEGDRGGAEE